MLSNGHASMLLWSVLFLTRTQAVNASTNAWAFRSPSTTSALRQIESGAGASEYHCVRVETTSGPPGGIVTSVGMAIARKWPPAATSRPQPFDYDIYAVYDGCLMKVGSKPRRWPVISASTTCA